jgi:hypothetical protein
MVAQTLKKTPSPALPVQLEEVVEESCLGALPTPSSPDQTRQTCASLGFPRG